MTRHLVASILCLILFVLTVVNCSQPTCQTDSNCSSGMYCSQGKCHNPCKQELDCIDQERCEKGRCKAITKDAGATEVAPDSGKAEASRDAGRTPEKAVDAKTPEPSSPEQGSPERRSYTRQGPPKRLVRIVQKSLDPFSRVFRLVQNATA